MQNYMNSYQQQTALPQNNPNAVSINIFTPQAYGSNPIGASNVAQNNGYYSLYGQNMNPNLPIYPSNYNTAIIQNPYNTQIPVQPNIQQMPVQQNIQQMPSQIQNAQPMYNQQAPQAQDSSSLQAQNGLNKANMMNDTNLLQKTSNEQTTSEVDNSSKTKEKTKKIVPLTDDYIKSIENYMNSENPKIRLIGTKELLERFKEDENRKDNPSLMPLLNKALKDTSPSVRFLGLTMLQLGYALGNDETVALLKDIQSKNQDKLGEDALLASEILLKMSASQKVEVPMTQTEIERAEKKESSKE